MRAAAGNVCLYQASGSHYCEILEQSTRPRQPPGMELVRAATTIVCCALATHVL